MRHYETTFIVDAHLQDDAIEKSVDKFLKFIKDKGGITGEIDRWGKRRLAYEIRKKQYGYYVCVRYEADGTFIQELEREFQIDETILRSLTILVHKSVIKEEMEHAGRKQNAEEDAVEADDPDAPAAAPEKPVQPEEKPDREVKESSEPAAEAEAETAADESGSSEDRKNEQESAASAEESA